MEKKKGKFFLKQTEIWLAEEKGFKQFFEWLMGTRVVDCNSKKCGHNFHLHEFCSLKQIAIKNGRWVSYSERK